MSRIDNFLAHCVLLIIAGVTLPGCGTGTYEDKFTKTLQEMRSPPKPPDPAPQNEPAANQPAPTAQPAAPTPQPAGDSPGLPPAGGQAPEQPAAPQ